MQREITTVSIRPIKAPPSLQLLALSLIFVFFTLFFFLFAFERNQFRVKQKAQPQHIDRQSQMQTYFFFFICAAFIIAIVISCVLRCRVIARRRREARQRLEEQNAAYASTVPATGNGQTSGSMAYYYSQGMNGGDPELYNGYHVPRQPGQTVVPATVLMTSANDPNGTGDTLVSQLFPQARVVQPNNNNNPNSYYYYSPPHVSSQNANVATTSYVPPNSVFYDRDMHRNANSDAVYGYATYLPRPPSEQAPSPAEGVCGASLDCGASPETGVQGVASATPVTVAAKLNGTKDMTSSDSSTR